MAVKVNPKSKNQKVVSLDSFKRKANPYEGAFTASVTSVEFDNVEELLEETEEDSPPWYETKMATPGNQAANEDQNDYVQGRDTPCQELCSDLEAWLAAYTLFKAKVCWLADEKHQTARMKYAKKRRQSAKSRRSSGKPTTRGMYKGKDWTEIAERRDDYPSWRPPTILQLLVQAYDRSETFELAAQFKRKPKRQTVPPDNLEPSTVKESHTPLTWSEYADRGWTKPKDNVLHDVNKKPHVYYTSLGDYDYWRYQSQLLQFHKQRSEPPPPKLAFYDHLVSFEMLEQMNYQRWLYMRDSLNPHIDVAPGSSSADDGKVLLCRYEGRKAAEFAPLARFNKRTTPFGSTQWDQFLCYYQLYKRFLADSNDLNGIDEEMLRSAAGVIWENKNTCLVFQQKLKRAASVRKDEPGLLMLPSPAVAKATAEETWKETVKTVTDNAMQRIIESNREEAERVIYSPQAAREATANILHPSGHSHETIANFVLAQKWKQLPNLLIHVPESFCEEKAIVVIDNDLLEDTKPDKQLRLKTG